jgi:hypothetical protein
MTHPWKMNIDEPLHSLASHDRRDSINMGIIWGWIKVLEGSSVGGTGVVEEW